MFPQPTFPPVWQDPRGSAAGSSLKPLLLLALQTLNANEGQQEFWLRYHSIAAGGSGLRVWSSRDRGLRVGDWGFRVWGSGLGIEGLGFRVEVEGVGFRV